MKIHTALLRKAQFLQCPCGHFLNEYSLCPFVSKVKNIDKVDGTDANKSEWIKLEFLLDPDNPASGSKYSRQFDIFKDG
jgi:hypothetical protein